MAFHPTHTRRRTAALTCPRARPRNRVSLPRRRGSRRDRGPAHRAQAPCPPLQRPRSRRWRPWAPSPRTRSTIRASSSQCGPHILASSVAPGRKEAGLCPRGSSVRRPCCSAGVPGPARRLGSLAPVSHLPTPPSAHSPRCTFAGRCIFGGVNLDFRYATFVHPVTTIDWCVVNPTPQVALPCLLGPGAYVLTRHVASAYSHLVRLRSSAIFGGVAAIVPIGVQVEICTSLSAPR